MQTENLNGKLTAPIRVVSSDLLDCAFTALNVLVCFCHELLKIIPSQNRVINKTLGSFRVHLGKLLQNQKQSVPVRPIGVTISRLGSVRLIDWMSHVSVVKSITIIMLDGVSNRVENRLSLNFGQLI